jgi:hypothetical protein
MLDTFYEANWLALYPAIIVLIVGAAQFGLWIGRRHALRASGRPDTATLTGAALGLLALLLGFSFSLALSRYDTRRDLVIEEANAIGSTANFALMLPAEAQRPMLSQLRDYTSVRIGLGVPFSATKLQRDIARSIELQGTMWQQAVALTVASPQSLPAYRFVGSLNEVNNIHERRISALRNHVPGEVMFALVGLAMVGMAFTGFHAGFAGARLSVPTLIMSLAVAVVIMLIIDLDRPARGLIRVSVQPLIDAAQGFPILP